MVQRVLAITGAMTIALGLVACGGSSSSSSTGGSSGHTVTIQNFAFRPAALTVSPGTTVTWTNQDTDTHTVTADDKKFDSKNLAQGKTFSMQFQTAGTHKYHCSIHSYMTGTITVG